MIEVFSEENFYAAIDSHHVYMVVFSGKQCPACRLLEKMIPDIEDEAGVMVLHFYVESFPALARRYGVRALPYTLIFKDGLVFEVFAGVRTKKAIVAAIKNAKAVE